ncbi:MAG: hypothetical protein ACYTG5_04520, partial [Planctomycetota bacterium]
MRLRAVLLLLGSLASGAILILWLLAAQNPAPLSEAVEADAREAGSSPPISDVAETSGEMIPAPEAVMERTGRETLRAQDWDGLLLRVVEKASGLPAAGARVSVVQQREARRRGREDGRADPRSPYEWLPLYGSTRFSDSSGELHLPRFEGRLLVSAASPGLYGVLRLEADVSEEQVIELVPDRELSIRVSDHAGKPVSGVPVGVVCRQQRRRQIIWSGRSDAEGSIRAPHLQIHMPAWASSSLLETEFLFPQRDRLGFPFSLEAMPAE